MMAQLCLMAEWKYVWMEYGAVCALTSGKILTLVLSAHSWDSIPRVCVWTIMVLTVSFQNNHYLLLEVYYTSFALQMHWQWMYLVQGVEGLYS